MRYQVVAALAAACLVGPLAAQEAAPPAPSAPPAPAAVDKPICRTVQPTGSHLGKRVCKTAAEWRAENAAAINPAALQQSYTARPSN